jgi:hypothetical protein
VTSHPDKLLYLTAPPFPPQPSFLALPNKWIQMCLLCLSVFPEREKLMIKWVLFLNSYNNKMQAQCTSNTSEEWNLYKDEFLHLMEVTSLVYSAQMTLLTAPASPCHRNEHPHIPTPGKWELVQKRQPCSKVMRWLCERTHSIHSCMAASTAGTSEC